MNRPPQMHRKPLTITDTNYYDSDIKFKIDDKLVDILKLQSKSITYKEFTLALIMFHMNVGNINENPTLTLNI